MLKLALRTFKNSIKINLIVIIQVTASILICIMLISSLLSRLEYYWPLEKLLNSKASAADLSTTFIDKETLESVMSDYKANKLYSDIKNIDEVYTKYSARIFKGEENYNFFSYDKNVQELFEPNMTSGEWLTSCKTKQGNVPVVIFQTGYDYELGDTMDMECTTYLNEEKIVTLEVVGIIGGETKIFGKSTGSPEFNNHLDFYDTPNNMLQNDKLNFLHMNPDAEYKAVIGITDNQILSDMNIVTQFCGAASIVKYNDDITDVQLTLNTSELGYRFAVKSENIYKIREGSINYVKSQIYTLLPILICAVVLSAISSLCIQAIIVKRNQRNYCIFLLCGLNRKKCLGLSILNMLIISLFSLILAVFAIFVFNITGFMEDTVISLGIWQLIGAAAVIIINLVFSMISPMKIFKTWSICESLRKN